MKVVLVCESIYFNASGGRVVRYLAKILKQNNFSVKIICLSEKREDYFTDSFYKEYDVEFLYVKKNVFDKISFSFLKNITIGKFDEILKEFMPNVVHFASFDLDKSHFLIENANLSGAKVILQPWTMGFFCAKSFGYRNHGICTECAGGNFLNAIKYKCVGIKGGISVINRTILRQTALKHATRFLASNSSLDEFLQKYGANRQKISRFPIPYDYTLVKTVILPEEDYYIFYGQPKDFKGLGVLIEAFQKLPHLRLKIYPAPAIEQINLGNNIEIVNNVTWNSGLDKAIASSKAVILPSLWATTTEYALYEAMVFKKPIIAFNVGVHKDILRDGFNALVLENQTSDELAKAIQKLDESPDLRMKLSQNGYETLERINDPNTLFEQLKNAYSHT